MNRPGKVFLLLVLVLSLRSLSFGWGCSGHEIVALIAQRQLSDVAAQKVLALLKSPGLYVNNKPGRGCNPKKYTLTNPSDLGLMAFYATFADDFRNTNKSTAPWHFWDVPLNSTTDPDLPQFCDKGCVVKAIQDQIDVLKSSSATKRARSKALALLIHFVGDLHQPLHIADNNDRGGNCVPVKFFGDEPSISTSGTGATPNLHGIWDTSIPEKIGHIRGATHDDDLIQYVDTLMSDFETDMADWKTKPVDVRAWALESHSHAVTEAYGDLPTTIDGEDPVAINTCKDDDDVLQRMLDLDETVNQKYVDLAKPVIEGQLARAGTRLAVILNQIWHD
jgi:hypothetical protein